MTSCHTVLGQQSRTFHPVGRVSVRQGLLGGKGNVQTGTSLFRDFLIVVTTKQGKVTAINEAGTDQRGGQLAFDNGETLNYEGRSPVPHTCSAHSIHPTPI